MGRGRRRPGSAAGTIDPVPAVREQLALLEARKLQYQRAALKAKRGHDLEQAKAHLRVAKLLEAQMAQVQAGHPLDLSKVSPTAEPCRAPRWQAARLWLKQERGVQGGGL